MGEMIYWTSKKSGVSIRYRAYKLRETQPTYSLLGKNPLAEVYVFTHKDHHGSCMGIVKGEGIKHYESKEEAFRQITIQLI